MQPDFFATHTNDWLILLGLAFFPRITLLFIGGPFAWFHWLGWVFTPHFLVAMMASFRYWDTNPVLVIISWLFCFGGTSVEARTAGKTRIRIGRRPRRERR